jgi:hypothetical protein
MGWPQITVLAMMAISLLLIAALNGKPRVGEYNFSVSLWATALNIWILWMGGFWS